jgi:hypothetical protein
MPDYYSPPEVVAVLGCVDTYLQWRKTQEPPRGHEHFHPSAFGKCLRKMQYERYVERGYMHPVEEEIKSNILRVFENGHTMHDRWRGYFEELGVLRGVWQCRNPFCAAYSEDGQIDTSLLADFSQHIPEFLKGRRKYGEEELIGVFKPERCVCGWKRFEYHEVLAANEELNFKGHADGILDFSRFDPGRYMEVKQSYLPEYLPSSPIVVDMKSCNTYDFQDIAEGRPHPYYLTQLTIYANLLDCEWALLLYEDKNNQKTMAFRVERNKDTLFARIRRQAREMIEMPNRLEDDGNVVHLLPPPKPLMRQDKECSFCPFKEVCHESPIWDAPTLRAQQIEFYGEEAYEPH